MNNRIKGPSRSRLSVRPRAVRAALSRWYIGTRPDHPYRYWIDSGGRTAPESEEK